VARPSGRHRRQEPRPTTTWTCRVRKLAPLLFEGTHGERIRGLAVASRSAGTGGMASFELYRNSLIQEKPNAV
jgi:hypothetical protein